VPKAYSQTQLPAEAEAVWTVSENASTSPAPPFKLIRLASTGDTKVWRKSIHFRKPFVSKGITNMATYILSKFTDQGIRNVKETTKRAEAFRETARKLGATVKEI
jgi:hypothetical protein